MQNIIRAAVTFVRKMDPTRSPKTLTNARNMKNFKLSNLVSLLAVCIMASVPTLSSAASKKNKVHIYADFSSADLFVTGTFVATGALDISGVAEMEVSVNANGMIAHCILTLTPDDGSGTIVIAQECQFASSPIKGRWQIVGGTGAYAQLKGNGSLLMPEFDEDMTGTIY